MAGTLTLSTLSDGTTSTSATNPIRGSARSWANFNGTTGTIRSSYNVSSVTINGTGNYSVNFTNAMPNTDYTVAGTTSLLATGNGANKIWLSLNGSNATATTFVNVLTESYLSLFNCDTVTVIVIST
jgi:hypothetical protein